MSPMADSSRHRFKDAVPALPEFTEAKRISPARPASLESDVKVPLAQAAITGGVAIIGIGMLALAFHWPIVIAPAVGGGVFILAWVVLLIDHRSLLKTIETIINRDLDGDKRVGPVAMPPVRVEYHEHEEQRDRTVFSDLPVPRRAGPAGLITFARAVALQGDTFSERTAGDHGYTREEWQELRDEFIEQAWAAWNHPNEPRQGVTLLRAGQMVLRKVAASPMPRQDWNVEES